MKFKWIAVLEAIAIIIVLFLWQPRVNKGAQKTISVTGEGSVTAAPDEFTFYPSYQKKGKSVQDAISEVSKQGNVSVAKLKELGIAEQDIKTNVTTNQDYFYGKPEQNNEFIAVYSITAIARNKELAQKALDYLVTTPTLYGVSPSSNFSNETRQKLELEAREKALLNAKIKAEQEAKTLGFTISEVLTVSDLNQYGGIPILDSREGTKADRGSTEITPPKLETGTQTLSFSVTVTFKFK